MLTLTKRRFDGVSAVVIGKFDGVHTGHQLLLQKTAQICKDTQITPVVYTFETLGDNIVSNEKKLELLHQQGIKAAYIQSFTEEFKQTSPEDFAKMLKNDFNAKHVIIGFNFRFGKNRIGDANTMQELCQCMNISCTVAEPVIFKGLPVSSTRIREEIKNGNMTDAKEMLGRDFSVTSKVVSGKRLGRELGFPTANINTDNLSVIPSSGVYASRVEINGTKYSAVTNVGNNPTVNEDNKTRIETHIIDYKGDLYEKEITVSFIEKIREERKFESIEELSKQLVKDKEKAVEILKGQV